MSNKDIVRYNMDDIIQEDANFNLIYGERSNGKSYQVKHKRAVIKYLETGKRFILMRRLKEEINNSMIEQYFQDVDVTGLTNGKYNCIVMYRKQLFFAVYDNETGKTKRYDKIGYAVSLSTEQNYAGASYLDVEDIIFEEFMSRSVYLAHEPDKLMNFYCTVDRKRGTTKIWLVGNTISRVCPYIDEWGLHKLISTQKQGTIVSKEVPDTDGNNLKIAVEYCASTGRSSHTLGKHSKMLNDGSWQCDPQPHLPKSKKCYETLYRFIFQFQNFRFICELLRDKEERQNKCWFIYPKYNEISGNILVVSDIINISRNWHRDIYNLNTKSEKLKNLFATFRECNIFYASDLCGTDFKQVIDFSIRR